MGVPCGKSHFRGRCCIFALGGARQFELSPNCCGQSTLSARAVAPIAPGPCWSSTRTRAMLSLAAQGSYSHHSLRISMQCSNLTGITSPDNQTRSWLTSQNNQKVVLTGIQYHFGPGAETGPDRPSRALEPSDRHLHTPKQPFHFKYHLFSCRIRPSPAVSGRFRPFSYVFQSIGAVRCRGSRLNTAPLELKRIKLESGIRKYQLTIPLSKSIKEWSIPL